MARWIFVPLYGCKCSNCDNKPYPFKTDSTVDDYWAPKYCPNCGEEMENGNGEKYVPIVG